MRAIKLTHLAQEYFVSGFSAPMTTEDFAQAVQAAEEAVGGIVDPEELEKFLQDKTNYAAALQFLLWMYAQEIDFDVSVKKPIITLTPRMEEILRSIVHDEFP